MAFFLVPLQLQPSSLRDENCRMYFHYSPRWKLICRKPVLWANSIAWFSSLSTLCVWISCSRIVRRWNIVKSSCGEAMVWPTLRTLIRPLSHCRGLRYAYAGFYCCWDFNISRCSFIDLTIYFIVAVSVNLFSSIRFIFLLVGFDDRQHSQFHGLLLQFAEQCRCSDW